MSFEIICGSDIWGRQIQTQVHFHAGFFADMAVTPLKKSVKDRYVTLLISTNYDTQYFSFGHCLDEMMCTIFKSSSISVFIYNDNCWPYQRNLTYWCSTNWSLQVNMVQESSRRINVLIFIAGLLKNFILVAIHLSIQIMEKENTANVWKLTLIFVSCIIKCCNLQYSWKILYR
jgi:hypothetical protein